MGFFTRIKTWSKYFPLITIVMISFLFLCFYLQTKLSATDINFNSLASFFSVSRGSVLTGHLGRLFTANLFHLNRGHLLSNIFGLLFFSSLLEITLGKPRVTIVILVSALGGTIGSILIHLVDWMVGSSTILFGVFGGVGVLIFKYKRELGHHFITALISWCVSIIPLTTLGYLSMKIVDQGAHVGGFVAGIITTLIIVHSSSVTDLHKPLGLKGKILLIVLLVSFGLSLIKEVLPLLPVFK